MFLRVLDLAVGHVPVRYHDLEPTAQPPGTGPTACPTGPGGPPDLRQPGQVGTPDFATALRFVT